MGDDCGILPSAPCLLPSVTVRGHMNKVAVFTKEYPPYVYGGAGVHVEYLCKELARLVSVEVRCFGDQQLSQGNLTVRGYGKWPEVDNNTDPRFTGAVDAFA